MQICVWKGAIPASLVAVAFVLLGFWVYSVAVGQDPAVTAGAVFGHLSFFAMFFGWPLALAVSFSLGALLRPFAERKGRVTARWIHWLTFALAGSILIPLLWIWLWGSSNGSLPWIPLGGVAGATAGGSYWYFGTRSNSDQQRPASA